MSFQQQQRVPGNTTSLHPDPCWWRSITLSFRNCPPLTFLKVWSAFNSSCGETCFDRITSCSTAHCVRATCYIRPYIKNRCFQALCTFWGSLLRSWIHQTVQFVGSGCFTSNALMPSAPVPKSELCYRLFKSGSQPWATFLVEKAASIREVTRYLECVFVAGQHIDNSLRPHIPEREITFRWVPVT